MCVPLLVLHEEFDDPVSNVCRVKVKQRMRKKYKNRQKNYSKKLNNIFQQQTVRYLSVFLIRMIILPSVLPDRSFGWFNRKTDISVCSHMILNDAAPFMSASFALV